MDRLFIVPLYCGNAVAPALTQSNVFLIPDKPRPMIRFVPNLYFMYREHAPLDRFAAARRDGFSHAELCYLDDLDVTDVKRAADEAGITVLSFNFPPGEVEPGVARGWAALPGREAETADLIARGLEWARILETRMAFAPLFGLKPDGATYEECEQVLIANLTAALPKLEAADFTLLIEPHCSKDFPGYVLDKIARARAVIEAVGSPHVRMLFDTYHVQRMEGDIARRFLANRDVIVHVQIGNAPDRHEPDAGELNHLHFFRTLADAGYDGWVAGEYFPAGKTSEGLAWMEKWGIPRV